jgi:hypothetical protein
MEVTIIRKVTVVYEYLETDNYNEHRTQMEYSGEWKFIRSWNDINELGQVVMYAEYWITCK